MRTSFPDTTPEPPALPAVDAIVVGASAGGVEALLKIFRTLPRGYRLPILAVLHVPSSPARCILPGPVITSPSRTI
jgi:two-component system chemotaxis response regulator CheB